MVVYGYDVCSFWEVDSEVSVGFFLVDDLTGDVVDGDLTVLVEFDAYAIWCVVNWEIVGFYRWDSSFFLWLLW